MVKEEFNDLDIDIQEDEDRSKKVKEGLDYNVDQLKKEILKRTTLITDPRTEQIYIFDGAIWRPDGESFIKDVCTEMLKDKFANFKFNNVVGYIQGRTYKKMQEPPTNLVCLENGILDLDNMELFPHTRNQFFLNKLPIYYSKSKTCGKIQDFLIQVLNEDDIAVFQEYLGYCLYRSYPFAKSLVFIGEGENGKSTLLEVVKTFLGKENISSRSLQEIADNRFAPYDLIGKLANIYADLSDKALIETGKFKILTGGDQLTVEQKFKRSQQFVNYAKLMFSCNRLPDTRDDTDAFFRRFILMTFPNTFTKDKARKKDDLVKELTTKDEMSGLLNWALEGLKNLIERGYFINSATTEQLREDYIRKASPVRAFFMDCLETSPDEYIPKRDLYNTFCEYCRQKRYAILSEVTFHEKLRQIVQVIEYKLGGQTRTWKGIKYSQNYLAMIKGSPKYQKLDEKEEKKP